MSLRQRVARRLREERGYSLVEMITAMAILGMVLGSLAGLFASSLRAEVDLNQRFQAQQAARLALDRIRGDIACAQSATVGTINAAGDRVQLDAPSCGGSVTWCALPMAGVSARYALYRAPGTSCTSSSTPVASYLTINAGVFSTTTAPSGQLQKVSVRFPVRVKTTAESGTYELRDDIVMRNSTRTP